MEREAEIPPQEALELAIDKAGELLRLEGELLAEGGDWSETLVIVHPDGATAAVRGLTGAQTRTRETLLAALAKVGVTQAVAACCYFDTSWEVSQDRAIAGMPLEQHPERREVLRVLAISRAGRTLGLRSQIKRDEDSPPRLGMWVAYEAEAVSDWLLEALKGVVEL